jgi:AAA family ATPase
LFIGATNHPWLLDSAITRPGRFGTHLYIGLPDHHARCELFKLALQKMPLAADADYAALADVAQDYTAAEVTGVCESAIEEAYIKYTATGTRVLVTQAQLLQKITATPARTTPKMLADYQRFAGVRPASTGSAP